MSSSNAHGANVWLTGRSELVDSEVAKAGQLGIGVGGARVAGNHVHDDGTEGFDPGWEAGGFKAVTHDVVVEGNEFDHNAGSGIWFDIGSSGIVIRDNRVHDNLRVGIFVEISSDVRVTANTVWSNGREGDGWLNGAGILVHTSTRVEVDHNLVAWNGDGIGVESQDRPDRPTDAPTDVRVHDNDVLMEDGPDTKIALGWVEDWAGPLFDPASHNSGEANRFWYPAPEGDFDRFAWVGPMSRLADFIARPAAAARATSPTMPRSRSSPWGTSRGPRGGVGPGDGGDAGARVQRAELELVGLLLALLLVVSLAGVRVGAVPARRVVVVALLVALGYALVVMAISRVDLVPDPLEGIALVTTVGIELVALGVVGLAVGRAVAARRRRDRRTANQRTPSRLTAARIARQWHNRTPHGAALECTLPSRGARRSTRPTASTSRSSRLVTRWLRPATGVSYVCATTSDPEELRRLYGIAFTPEVVALSSNRGWDMDYRRLITPWILHGRGAIRRLRPDYTIINGALPMPLPGRSCVVSHDLELRMARLGGTRRLYKRLTYSFSDDIVATCSEIRDLLAVELRRPASRIGVIPTCFDLSGYMGLPLAEREPTILHMGTIDYKNPQATLAAFAALQTPARLVLTGKVDDALRTTIDRLPPEVRGRIELPGLRWMRRSCATSWGECESSRCRPPMRSRWRRRR